MSSTRWDRPDEFDDVLLLSAADDARRRTIRDRLALARGERRPGVYPRFKIITASSGPESLRRARRATVAAVNLALPEGPGLETIRELRETLSQLAILAYAVNPTASDAMAAIMAGADFVHDCRDDSAAALAQAVERAVDRRKLTHSLEEHEAEVEKARGRLAQMSGEMGGMVTGLWPVRSLEDVLPFREAARRYLLAARGHFAGDPRGLANALGVSYFSLRRLLARYDVPFPSARTRR
jgi:DNA-binding NarL/FixJ family response regulator